MQQLDTLNANIAALQIAVNDVKVKVDALKAAAVDPALVQAAADNVAAITTQVAGLA